jgi:hypothetical protein
VATFFVVQMTLLTWVMFQMIINREVPIWPTRIIGVLLAVGAGWLTWSHTGRRGSSLVSWVLLGGLLVGGMGFAVGFIGPLIFMDSNLGPLIGIFFTGPIGFVLGCLGGLASGLEERKAKSARPGSS